MVRLLITAFYALAMMQSQSGRLCAQDESRKAGEDKKSLRVPPKEPAEALKTFRLRPGFRGGRVGSGDPQPQVAALKNRHGRTELLIQLKAQV